MNGEKQSHRASIVTPRNITVFCRGKSYNVSASDSGRYLKVKEALKSGDWYAVYKALDLTQVISEYSHGEIAVIGGQVYYKEKELLHGTEVNKLLELIEAGYEDVKPLVNFICNLLENPSKANATGLYDFMEYRSLPIDEDGYVIGYKFVDRNYYSCWGNTDTVVVKGTVDEGGHIYNGVGETIEVLRRCVVDDRNVACGEGLHIGSFDFVKGKVGSGHLMVVRFNPRDAVSVPLREVQKLRVCKYEVIAELDVGKREEITTPLYNQQGKVENTGYHNVRDSKGRFTKTVEKGNTNKPYHNVRDQWGRFTKA